MYGADCENKFGDEQWQDAQLINFKLWQIMKFMAQRPQIPRRLTSSAKQDYMDGQRKDDKGGSAPVELKIKQHPGLKKRIQT